MKVDLKIVEKLIEDKDGELLNDIIIKGVRYITIKCNKDGNVWTAALNSVRNKGGWCWECCKRNKVKKVDINKVKDLLFKKDFELLTTTHINFWTKIKIRCPKHNREWETSYGTLVRGDSNCSSCGHGSVDFVTLNKIITDNNAIFVKRIKTNHSVRNILLRCNIHDHEWTTNVVDIQKLERWCYYCSWEKRKTSYEKIKAAIEKKGGVLLEKDCCGSLTKIKVKCANEHIWTTCFDYINQNYWCPECPHKTQAKLHDIIKSLFPDYKTKFNYRGFKWLKSNKQLKQRMEIDIWIPEIKLAIEYDGEQHFMPIKFSSKITDEKAKKALSDLKRRDKKKTKLIVQHPNEIKHFVRFDYRDLIDKENVLVRLRAHGVKI